MAATGNLKINMYADDCILFTSGNNCRMSLNIQSHLDDIQQWRSNNRLKLSETKSKSILFASISKLNLVDYSKRLYIANTCLDFVNKYKYLGITLDKHMSLTDLVSDVKKKVIGHLFKLRKLRKFITQFCAISIYKQTILPLLDYAGFLLQSINVSDRSDLQVLQNHP